ncbi:3,4-dihydroxy-2-butanone-4-phosphate synthase [Rhodococcus sp. NPDC056960]|uniref:3,4-dihydroxy-2-butanone-4-phosphate synthase n=1 Tax=Rhodococcus sp. NPDC056960 TaxID=3345982 RepID=UPI00364576FB
MSPLLPEADTSSRHSRISVDSSVRRTLAAGGSVVVVFGGQSSLFYAALLASTATTAFAIRHGSGLLRTVLPYSRAEELMIPSMDASFSAKERMCVAVDAAAGITTGISAVDRSLTARILADSTSVAADLVRPGHMMVTAVDGTSEFTTVSGIAMQTASLSGLGAAAVVTELVGLRNPTGMMEADEAQQFAATHALPVLRLPFG